MRSSSAGRLFLAEAKAGPLNRPVWLYVGSSLRWDFRQQGVYFQPVPFA